MTRPAYATRTLLLSAGLVLGTAAAAHASTFTWSSSGTIGAPQNAADPATAESRTSSNPGTVAAGSPAFVYDGAGSSTLTWGDPLTPGTVENPTPINSLSIQGGESSHPLSFDDGDEATFLLGALTWTNKSVFHGGGTWYTTLSFDIDLNGVELSPKWRIEVKNTPDALNFMNDNAAYLAHNNITGLNEDFITFLDLSGLDLGLPLDLGSGFSASYQLKFDFGRASTRPEGDAGEVCSFGDFGSQLVEATWANCEGNISTLGLHATIRYDAPDEPPAPVAPIPLPAAGWLLLGGLAGLGALRARRRAA